MSSRQFSEQEHNLQFELERRRHALREVMLRSFEDSDETQLNKLAGHFRHANDESLGTLIAHLDLFRYRHWVEEASAIERALADLRAGIYGLCDDCQQRIEYDRLQVEPTTRRCMACQQHHEPLCA